MIDVHDLPAVWGRLAAPDRHGAAGAVAPGWVGSLITSAPRRPALASHSPAEQAGRARNHLGAGSTAATARPMRHRAAPPP